MAVISRTKLWFSYIMDLDEADKYKVEQKKQDMKEYILYHSPYIKDKHYLW